MLDIRNLSKNYGDLVALKNLDLQVPRGEIFCFLGPNGAGKTTTIKLLTGLLRPRTGTVHVDGIDLLANPRAAKQRIGYIPDTPFLYDRLTPEEFCRFTGDLYGIPRDRVDRAIEESFTLFSLHDYRHMLIHELSHGLRQRVTYAATFLHEPTVLFVDEPLVGLDPFTIRLIKDLFATKARAGMTIFLTTHILALAEDVGHRIGIIARGELIALGSLPELLSRHGGRNLEDTFLRLTAGHKEGVE